MTSSFTGSQLPQLPKMKASTVTAWWHPRFEGGVLVFLCYSGFGEAFLFSLNGDRDVNYSGLLVVRGDNVWVARDLLLHKLVAERVGYGLDQALQDLIVPLSIKAHAGEAVVENMA